MRAMFALLVGYAAAQTAEAPPHIDYEVNLKHTEDVPAEKIVGVFGEIGVQAEAAEYVLAKLKERGEGVVAQCPKAACEKVAKAFTDIGLDAEARKIEVPASDYDGSDVMVLDEPNLMVHASQPGGLLVAFTAPWCTHCKSMEPELKKAATELKAAGIRVGAVDVAAFPAIAQRLSVKMLPSVRYTINGDWLEYQGARTADGIVAFGKQAKSGPTEDEKLVQEAIEAKAEAAEAKGDEAAAEGLRLGAAAAADAKAADAKPASKVGLSKAAPPAAAEAAAAPAEAAAAAAEAAAPAAAEAEAEVEALDEARLSELANGHEGGLLVAFTSGGGGVPALAAAAAELEGEGVKVATIDADAHESIKARLELPAELPALRFVRKGASTTYGMRPGSPALGDAAASDLVSFARQSSKLAKMADEAAAAKAAGGGGGGDGAAEGAAEAAAAAAAEGSKIGASKVKDADPPGAAAASKLGASKVAAANAVGAAESPASAAA